MASIKREVTKNGRVRYIIRVSRGRGKSNMQKTWYAPEGWSQKAIDREISRIAAEYERAVNSGEILSRADQEEHDKTVALEEARILTFEQYVTKVFMPELTIRCAEGTRACYETIFKRTIFPAIGNFRITNITSAQISALLLRIQSAGKAHSTCVKVYTIINAVFKKAFYDNTVEINPMLKVQRPKPRKDECVETDPEAYTLEEVKALISVMETQPLKWQVYTRLLIDTGLRRGEALGLQWPDIDFENHTISIRRNLCYTPNKGVYIDTPKNRKLRTVPLGNDCIDLLKRLQEEQAECLSKWKDDLVKNGAPLPTPDLPWVFTRERSNLPIHPQTPTRYFKELSKSGKANGLHPHKLRHTFASLAITNGADVASVSETLGHSDKALTLKMYTHADEASKKRVSDLVQSLISGNTDQE